MIYIFLQYILKKKKKVYFYRTNGAAIQLAKMGGILHVSTQSASTISSKSDIRVLSAVGFIRVWRWGPHGIELIARLNYPFERECKHVVFNLCEKMRSLNISCDIKTTICFLELASLTQDLGPNFRDNYHALPLLIIGKR